MLQLLRNYEYFLYSVPDAPGARRQPFYWTSRHAYATFDYKRSVMPKQVLPSTTRLFLRRLYSFSDYSCGGSAFFGIPEALM